MSEHKHELQYCLAPYDFPKKYGRWQVRCTKCDYQSRLVSDYPPKQEVEYATK